MSDASPACPSCGDLLQPGMLRCRACGERLSSAFRTSSSATASSLTAEAGRSASSVPNSPSQTATLPAPPAAMGESSKTIRTGTVLNLKGLLKPPTPDHLHSAPIPPPTGTPASAAPPIVAPGATLAAAPATARPNIGRPEAVRPIVAPPAVAPPTPSTSTSSAVTPVPNLGTSSPGESSPSTNSSSSMKMPRASSLSGRMEVFGADAIRVECECGAKFRTKGEAAGKKVKCPKCGSAVIVPGGSLATGTAALAEKRKFVDLAAEIAALPPQVGPQADQAAAGRTTGDLPVLESGTKIESGSKPGSPTSGSAPKKKKLSKSRIAKLLKAAEPKEGSNSQEAEKRRQAILELGLAENDGLHEAIEKYTTDSWITVREAVATALGDLGRPESTPALLRMLDDEVPEVRRNAIAAIGKLRDARATRAMIVMALQEPHFRFAALDAITRMSVAATPVLTQILAEKDPGYALEAAVVAGRTRDAKLLEPLAQLLGSQYAIVRGQAAESLGQIGDKKATPSLCKLLADPDSGVRVAAAGALARLADPRSLPSLMKSLGEDDADVLERVITALGDIGDKQAVEPLLRLIDHPKSEVRGAAADALGKIGASEAASPLTRLLHDTDEAVRLKAIAAFRKFKAGIAVNPLLALLLDPNPQIRLRAIDTLGEIGDDSATDDLIHALQNDSTMEVRQMAAKALGAIGSADGIEPLEQALEDEFPVRCRAITSLGQIGASATLPALLAMLRDPVPEVRYHTTQALAELGNANALKPLEELLADEHPMVRRGAAKALVKLGDPRGEALLDEKKLAAYKKRSGPKFDFSRLNPQTLVEMAKSAPPAVGLGLIAIPVILVLGFAVVGLGLLSGGRTTAIVRGRPAALNFAIDGQSITVGFNKGVVEIWPVAGGSPTATAHYPGNASSSILTTGVPNTILSFSDKQIATLVDGTLSPVAALPGPSSQLLVSPDGKHAASVGQDGTITLVDLQTAKPLQAIQLNLKPVTCLALSNGGGQIAGGRKDGGISIWDTQTGASKAELKLGAVVPAAIGFAPAGDKLLVANFRGGVGLYDIKSRKRLNEMPFEGKTGPIFNGARFVGAGDDLVLLTGANSLATWKISTNEVKTAAGFDLVGSIGSISVSPTGDHAAFLDTESADVLVVSLPSLEVTAVLSKRK